MTPAAAAAARLPGFLRAASPDGLDGRTPETPTLPEALLDGAGQGGGLDGLSDPLTMVLLLGLVSVLPGLLMAVTAFTRIVVVLGFVRSALSTPGIPPNQVVIGLSLLLTAFVMGPTFSAVDEVALQPFLAGQMEASEAVTAAVDPFRTFMLAQVREEDLAMFLRIAEQPDPATPADLSLRVLLPAFVVGELRTAFLIGVVLFGPFLVVALVVSAVLTSLGMVMLPPALVSLPLKVLLFVAADGWSLVVESLVGSFAVATATGAG